MDGDGGDGWTPSPRCGVVISVSLGRSVSRLRHDDPQVLGIATVFERS
jgi:hypothetical protein